MRLSDFQLESAKLIRYFYSGSIVIIGIALWDHCFVFRIYDAIGSTAAIILIFSIGSIIHLLHKNLIGELFLYDLIFFLNDKDRNLIFKNFRIRCIKNRYNPSRFLTKLGIRSKIRRRAYLYVRRNIIPENARKALDMAHSELHMLWITYMVFIIVIIFKIPEWSFLVKLIITLMFFLTTVRLK